MYIVEKICVDAEKPEFMVKNKDREVCVEFAKHCAQTMLDDSKFKDVSGGGIVKATIDMGKVLVSEDKDIVYYKDGTGKLVCSWIVRLVDEEAA